MSVLPHDILREIGRHWNGHRLHYTCVALYASWSPDNYIVTEQAGTPTIQCMPNGTHHGKSVATKYIPWYNSTSTEIIEYDRGALVSVTCSGLHWYEVKAIIDGWVASWQHIGRSYDPANMSDVHGDVLINDVGLRLDVRLCDFTAIAREMIAQRPPPDGGTGIELMLQWGRPMPGTTY